MNVKSFHVTLSGTPLCAGVVEDGENVQSGHEVASFDF